MYFELNLLWTSRPAGIAIIIAFGIADSHTYHPAAANLWQTVDKSVDIFPCKGLRIPGQRQLESSDEPHIKGSLTSLNTL